MTSSTIRTVLLATLLLTALAGRPAAAQSTAELREENRALRTELADLTAEMDAARAEIERLRALVADLMKQIDAHAAGHAAGGSGRAPLPPLEPEKLSIDESRPDASPRAALNAIKKAYTAEFGTVEIGAEDSTERRVFARNLDRWATAQQRQLRLPISWHVRIKSAAQYSGRNVMILVQAVDPETHVTLGSTFPAYLPRSAAGRILRRVEDQDIVVLKGTMHPIVMINESRRERGPFDNPPFVGPFAEFAISADVQSLSTPQPDEAVAGAEDGAQRSGG